MHSNYRSYIRIFRTRKQGQKISGPKAVFDHHMETRRAMSMDEKNGILMWDVDLVTSFC